MIIDEKTIDEAIANTLEIILPCHLNICQEEYVERVQTNFDLVSREKLSEKLRSELKVIYPAA